MNSEIQVFYITICTLACGLIITLTKLCYKSKCSEIDIGCIHIKRDTENETEFDIEHPLEIEENKV